MYIHREGYTILTVVLVVVIGVLLTLKYILHIDGIGYNVAGVVGAIIFLLFLQFFRNPAPSITLNEKHIIAPADGKVVVIERVMETEFFKEERLQISIFMSPFNVHVNRNPVSGIIRFFKYHPGKFLVAWHPKSSTENERTTTVTEMTDGTQILFRQIAGALARRIRWYIKEGDQVTQGQEYGFIKFGSRVDIFLPLTATVNVQINQVTKGGETVIATLS